jgi:hypothetical protein
MVYMLHTSVHDCIKFLKSALDALYYLSVSSNEFVRSKFTATVINASETHISRRGANYLDLGGEVLI